MELSFQTTKIKKASMNGSAARKALGDELARIFLGQIADMREAMFLGELPSEREVTLKDGGVILNYPLRDLVSLEVEPVGVGKIDAAAWPGVHRVKLVRVHNQGVALL